MHRPNVIIVLISRLAEMMTGVADWYSPNLDNLSFQHVSQPPIDVRSSIS